MKILPQKKKSPQKYPDLKTYKSKLMTVTFTLGVALTPFTVTSCMGARRATLHKDNQTINTNKKVNSTIKEEKIKRINSDSK